MFFRAFLYNNQDKEARKKNLKRKKAENQKRSSAL